MRRDGPRSRAPSPRAGRRRTWPSAAATTERLRAGRATTGPGTAGGGRGPGRRSVDPTPERREGEGRSGPADGEKPSSWRRRAAPSSCGEGLGWLRGEQQRSHRTPWREEAVGVWHGLGQAESPGLVWSETSWGEQHPVEKLISGSRGLRGSLEQGPAPSTPLCEPGGQTPSHQAPRGATAQPRTSPGSERPPEPWWQPVMGLCRDSRLQLSLLRLPAILRAPPQLLSLFLGENLAASAAHTSALPVGLARQVLCAAGLLPAPARTKFSSSKYTRRSALSRD